MSESKWTYTLRTTREVDMRMLIGLALVAYLAFSTPASAGGPGNISGCYSGEWVGSASFHISGGFGICVTKVVGQKISGHLSFDGGNCGSGKVHFTNLVLSKRGEVTFRGIRPGCGAERWDLRWTGSGWRGMYNGRYNGTLEARRRQ